MAQRNSGNFRIFGIFSGGSSTVQLVFEIPNRSRRSIKQARPGAEGLNGLSPSELLFIDLKGLDFRIEG